ncbi:MAG: hypothetical protein Harvfovirus11_15 [Harvfovirus sp.]|uniref:Uncharacterized protein n=1 Tax=Harvfovirus sp. TaxID=2487768 RepID=A0A3G5A558_9VIRU|nr:MAG: hypothetical protein Harvfovirus11_15 [Harvfovirus sp.]
MDTIDAVEYKKSKAEANAVVYQLQILKKNFNIYSETLADFLGGIAPKSSFMLYKGTVKSLVSKNSDKLIDMFILSALVYEDEILSGDDDFFLGACKGKNVGKRKEFIEFKTVWNSFDDENRLQIKLYMKLLCQIARKYFDLKYSA